MQEIYDYEGLIKTPKQIEGIRQASRLAAACLTMIQEYVVEGVSTLYLNNIIAKHIAEAGGVCSCKGYMGYPYETCISVNDVICHGIPSDDTILKKGDILNIDVVVKLGDYYGDTSRMYYVEPVSPEDKRLCNASYEALLASLRMVRDDRHTGDIGWACEKVVKKYKYSTLNALSGHGVGCKMHENPAIPFTGKKYTGVRLRAGNVITIEPILNAGTAEYTINADGWTMRTRDGKKSAQWEHTVLVLPDSYEILSQ